MVSNNPGNPENLKISSNFMKILEFHGILSGFFLTLFLLKLLGLSVGLVKKVDHKERFKRIASPLVG